MGITTALILGLIIAIGCTIAACILIVPEKKRASLNKFWMVMHDIFNFKDLLLEKILKVLYVFSTLFCIAFGFFMLFSGYRSFWDGSFHSYALQGFLVMILGPIFTRISYEFLMMTILLVKNTMSINNKLSGKAVKKEEPVAVAAAAEKAEPKMVFCPACGTRYDANSGGCPNGCKPE